jgi:ferritin-like metal-binding protein YciE
MTAADNTLNDWLRDAHAMEQQALTMLKAQQSRLENYPEVRKRITEHIAETERQAELIRGCLKARGEGISALKDTGGRLMALAQALGGIFLHDEVVKGSLVSYAFEHFEVASYRMLIAASKLVGDQNTQSVCEGILAEEEAMARWLAEHADSVVETYFTRAAEGSGAAKR